MPVQLRSLDRSAVTLAGELGASNTSKISDSLDAAHTGSARWIIQATGEEPQGHEDAIRQLHTSRPSLALSGGPDRTLEEFLEIVPSSRFNANEIPPVVSLILPRNERLALVNLLERTSNANVSALLNIRDLKGLIRLHPASHAAGAPYDTGVLTLALLIEGGHFDPAFASQIGDIANTAALGEPRAIGAAEELVMATLSLGRQLDFRSLANLAAFTDSIGTWAEMATIFRAQPDRIPQLYTALHFQKGSHTLFNYLATHPETGNGDIDAALLSGPGSLDYLLDNSLPVYQPALIADKAISALEPFRPKAFAELAVEDRSSALYLKFGLMLTAGLFFAFAMAAAWRGSSEESEEISRMMPSVMARDLFISCVVAICLWIIFEPEILKSPTEETDSGPRIEFAVASALESLQSPVKAMQDINQVTLLVLVLFFVIQLVIYCFCLIKLKEISKQSLSASMKLQLLENEENLFDFGLYVGLGGTVLSLILVAVGIVEASLMAAYASTLFGILFVAMLKVMHLRPYRRKLILEAGS